MSRRRPTSPAAPRPGYVEAEQFDFDFNAEAAEQFQIDPHVSGTSSRRSDKELARMLDLIDNLPFAPNGKEGRA